MLEKLMYFLEAIYMVLTDEDYLFEEDFLAWNFRTVKLFSNNISFLVGFLLYLMKK